MKTIRTLISSLALGVLALGSAHAESVHQTLTGDAAKTGGGQDALAAKAIETKTLPSGEKVARLVSTTPQWGFVNYWFGLPSPSGTVTLRLRAYLDETEPGSYAFYIKRAAGEPLVKKIEIPAGAAKNEFVTIDIPVEMAEEWNGLALKKIAASDKPGIWVESISVIKP